MVCSSRQGRRSEELPRCRKAVQPACGRAKCTGRPCSVTTLHTLFWWRNKFCVHATPPALGAGWRSLAYITIPHLVAATWGLFTSPNKQPLQHCGTAQPKDQRRHSRQELKFLEAHNHRYFISIPAITMPLKQPNRRDLVSSPSGTNNMNLVSTPTHRSPIKRARKGISAKQKQALIDNLQLESIEFAEPIMVLIAANATCSYGTRQEATSPVPSSGPGLAFEGRDPDKPYPHVPPQNQDGGIAAQVLREGATPGAQRDPSTTGARQRRRASKSPKASVCFRARHPKARTPEKAVQRRNELRQGE